MRAPFDTRTTSIPSVSPPDRPIIYGHVCILNLEPKERKRRNNTATSPTSQELSRLGVISYHVVSKRIQDINALKERKDICHVTYEQGKPHRVQG